MEGNERAREKQFEFVEGNSLHFFLFTNLYRNCCSKHRLKILIVLFSIWQREKAEVIQTSLFVAGLNTLLQTWFGTRLPVVIGPSYTFVVPAVFVVLANRYNFYIDPYDVSIVIPILPALVLSVLQ